MSKIMKYYTQIHWDSLNCNVLITGCRVSEKKIGELKYGVSLSKEAKYSEM